MYVVLEIQTNADGTVGNLVSAYEARGAAESAFHSILAADAISALPTHAAVLMTSEGSVIDSRCYTHEAPSAEEGE